MDTVETTRNPIEYVIIRFSSIEDIVQPLGN